jgi:hypothetical protein
MVTVAKASEVWLQIERDFVNTLEHCPRMREESSRELLVSSIGSRLGAELGLRMQGTARTFVIELVRVCARQPHGLELLVDGVAYLDPLAPELPTLHCLCDEWQAAHVYADDTWPDLRSRLHSIRLAGEDDLAELAELRRLAARATGARMVELPTHCANLWHVFVHLAGANTLPNALPPCMVLLECVAQEIGEPVLAAKLQAWNRRWAKALQLTDLLDAAPWRAAERRPEVRDVALIIQLEPDPVDGNRILVSYWRQWDTDGWCPHRGADLQVTAATLETEIDRLIGEMEIMLGARTDAASTGQIWLEFVLPADLLNLPVQLWSKTPLVDEKIPLVLDHPIVVRSLERLRTPRLHLAWRRRWAQLATEPVRPYWSRPSGDGYFTRLAAELSYDQRIMSLVLSEPPEPGNVTAHREINAALHAGLPAIIWHRSDCSLTEFREAVMTMVADGALINLPRRVAALRRDALRLSAATPGHPGREVAILWDDPDRLPEPPRGIG